MKIVRYKEIKSEKREDNREIFDLIRFEINGMAKFFRVRIPAGVKEKEHYHKNSDEIFLFLKDGKIIVNNKDYKFNNGDLVVLEKNDKHKIVADNEMELIGLKIPDINDKVIVA